MKKHLFVLATLLLFFSTSLHSQEAVVNPPDSLVVEGVPKIPASLADTAGRYTAYRGANIVDWHPTQRSMLISTRFAETPQLHLVSTPSGERHQLTFFSDAVRILSLIHI